ncbi:MAG: hypothetical protein ACU0CO_07155, partial [Shimia sp.]
GAVTVDWVVLTAALVGLGIATLATVGEGSDLQARRMAACLSQVGEDMKHRASKRTENHEGVMKIIDRNCRTKASKE